MKEDQTLRVAVAWNALPMYGARLLRELTELEHIDLEVFATPSPVSFQDVESLLRKKVHVMEPDSAPSFADFSMETPDLWIHTGWAYPAFLHLAREAKASGASVVSMIDNCWKGTLRQYVGGLVYRLKYQRLFDAAWVPGESGKRFCRFLGVPEMRIYKGLYSGNVDAFTCGPPLDKRPKQMLFVGQLIERKGMVQLADVAETFLKDHPDWQITAYGSGPLGDLLENAGVQVRPFAPPEEIAGEMKRSRFLLIPALEDHWPLVVHEACLSGCSIIHSNVIGDRFEFCREGENAFACSPGDSASLLTAMRSAAESPLTMLKNAHQISSDLASEFGPSRFRKAFLRICADLLDESPAPVTSS